MARSKKKKDVQSNNKPDVMDEDTMKICGLRLSSPIKMKKPRTKEETFKLLQEGKLRLKNEYNILVVSEYETEATEDAEKRENSKYITDRFPRSKQHIKKRKIRKEYVFIKGHDSTGKPKLWKFRLPKKPKPEEIPYETPFIYKSVLENDRNRQMEVIDCNRTLWERRNTIDDWRPGIYDRMPDDLLLMFDENVRNEDGKKRRFTAFEFMEINPEKVSEIIKPFRSPIMSRLKKFEDERNERQLTKPMLEVEKQRYVRKMKADEAKTKYLEKMSSYLKDNLYTGVREMINEEGERYQSAIKEFRRIADAVSAIVMKDMERYFEIMLNDEINDALALRREALEEEIKTTALHKERELQDSYKNIFLPYELSKQKELFQLEMSSYIQYWITKMREIQKQVDIQKQYLNKQLETTKILQATEHIPSLTKKFCDKVKKVQIKSKLEVEEALLPLKEKIETYVKFQKENDQLLDTIKSHDTVISEFIRKLREFVNITQPVCEEKLKLMDNLNELEQFKQQLLDKKTMTDKSSSTSVEYVTKTVSDISIVEPVQSEKEEKHHEIFFSMAHRILSDGNLDENAKYLLKIKFIISDLLKRIMPSGSVTEEEEEGTIDDIKSLKQDSISEEEKYITNRIKKVESFSVINKLMEINEKLDLTFQIVGDKYSIPDFVTVGSYLNKRSMSVEKIIKKHREMFENIGTQ